MPTALECADVPGETEIIIAINMFIEFVINESNLRRVRNQIYFISFASLFIDSEQLNRRLKPRISI